MEREQGRGLSLENEVVGRVNWQETEDSCPDRVSKRQVGEGRIWEEL